MSFSLKIIASSNDSFFAKRDAKTYITALTDLRFESDPEFFFCSL
jgi:hypothetical protein